MGIDNKYKIRWLISCKITEAIIITLLVYFVKIIAHDLFYILKPQCVLKESFNGDKCRIVISADYLVSYCTYYLLYFVWEDQRLQQCCNCQVIVMELWWGSYRMLLSAISICHDIHPHQVLYNIIISYKTKQQCFSLYFTLTNVQTKYIEYILPWNLILLWFDLIWYWVWTAQLMDDPGDYIQ